MIGSSTLIVKEGGKYRLHIFSGLVGMTGAKTKVGAFRSIKKSEKGWGKPDKENLTDVEIETIRVSHQCISSTIPAYSQFAGDSVGLLDLDGKKLFTRNRDDGDAWIEYVPRIRDLTFNKLLVG